MTCAAENKLSDLSDMTLISESLNHNHRAFEELIERNNERLYLSVLRLTNSVDLAEEIVQDTFVQAFINLDKFRREAKFSTWLFRIAMNKYLNMRRRKRPVVSLEHWKEASDFEPLDTKDSAERSLQRHEDRQRVLAALNRLDVNAKAILILREIDGLSYDELAQALSLKQGTVRSRLARARAKLHHILSSSNEMIPNR